MKIWFLAIFVCFLSVPAMAQVEEKQTLAEGVVEKSNMMGSLALIIESMEKKSDDIFFVDTVTQVDKERYLENASQLLMAHFTDEELKAMDAFYTSETGMSIAQKMPYYQAAMGKILEKLIVQRSRELIEE
jgi:hypothetical protein